MNLSSRGEKPPTGALQKRQGGLKDPREILKCPKEKVDKKKTARSPAETKSVGKRAGKFREKQWQFCGKTVARISTKNRSKNRLKSRPKIALKMRSKIGQKMGEISGRKSAEKLTAFRGENPP